MARAVARGEAGQRAAILTLQVLLGDRHGDEVVGAARGEDRVGGGEGHEALARQAGGGAHQQLLGHAHLVEAVGMGLREDVQVGVFGEVGGEADDVGPLSASSTSAWPKGAGFVRWPSAAIEAIIAEVVSALLRCCRSRCRTCLPAVMAVLPRRARPAPASHSSASTRMKWVFSRASRNGTPLPILVSQMIMRGWRPGAARAASKARDDAVEVVAVDALGEPAEGLELVAKRLEAQHLGRGAIGLLVVDVDDGDQVVELQWCRPTCAPPRSSPRPARRPTAGCRRRLASPCASGRAPCRRRSPGPGRANRR